MKKLDFDMTYCGIDLCVHIVDYDDSLEIDNVFYYSESGKKEFDWQSAFEYKNFIDFLYDTYNNLYID